MLIGMLVIGVNMGPLIRDLTYKMFFAHYSLIYLAYTKWISYFNSLLFFGISSISVVFPVIRVFPVNLGTRAV